MKILISFWMCLFCCISFSAIHSIGDKAPNICWHDHEDNKVCVDDFKDSVKVLLFTAGWCHPCNEEIKLLVPKLNQYDKKPIQFISLSLAGWGPNTLADLAFLKSWKNTYKIPFPVVAAEHSMTQFWKQSDIRLPSVVILDKKNIVRLREVNPGVSRLLKKAVDIEKL